MHKLTGKLVAVKVLQSNAEQDGEARKMVLNEVRTVFQARSDHLVAFHDAFHHEGSLHLVLEYCDMGSLEGLYEALLRPGAEHMMDEMVRRMRGISSWGASPPCFFQTAAHAHRLADWPQARTCAFGGTDGRRSLYSLCWLYIQDTCCVYILMCETPR